MEGHARDGNRWRVYVKIGRLQQEKRFPLETPYETREAWRDETKVALRKIKQKSLGRKHSLTADIRAYLALAHIQALTSYDSRVCELERWLPLLGHFTRGDITRDHILAARDHFLAAGYAPKSINHSMRALRHVYRVLDGSKADTPLDDIPKLEEPPPDPKFVSAAVIRRVGHRLTDPKTRARFMVLTATGQRPAQLKRATKADVDLRRRVWMVKPAKGGNAIAVALTDDMIAAFKALEAAEAWGDYDGSDYAKALYAAGWPRGVRPYNAKHTVGITLAEAGAEWEDIRDWFGHKDLKTTRIYTGFIASRLRGTAKRLEGRIGWAASRLPAASGSQPPKHAETRRKTTGVKKANSRAKKRKSA